MNKQIKRLQKLLTDGKLTAAEYAADLKDLLDDELIKQDEFDGAKDFEVEDEDSKLIFSQSDLDRQLLPKARSLVKKALKDAGVNLDGIENKDLLSNFGNLALQGQKKGSLTVDEAGLNDLQKKAKQFDDLQPKVKALTLENAVLKAAGSYKPVNQKQVVRALEDYKEFLEYDEDENLVPKSIDKALKKLAEAEPNLFTNAAAGNQEDDPDDEKQQQSGFQGKPPGGAGTSVGKDQEKQAAQVAEALSMMGIKPQK